MPACSSASRQQTKRVRRGYSTAPRFLLFDEGGSGCSTGADADDPRRACGLRVRQTEATAKLVFSRSWSPSIALSARWSSLRSRSRSSAARTDSCASIAASFSAPTSSHCARSSRGGRIRLYLVVARSLLPRRWSALVEPHAVATRISHRRAARHPLGVVWRYQLGPARR